MLDYHARMGLSRNIWPGKGAWIVGPKGAESQGSRHLRRAAREQALYRRKHPGRFRRAASRARELLTRAGR
jgi:hypothetical protein